MSGNNFWLDSTSGASIPSSFIRGSIIKSQYSARNMLRMSQSSSSYGADEPSWSNQITHDLRDYSNLTVESFIFFEEQNDMICLLCGVKKKLDGKSEYHLESHNHCEQYQKLRSVLLDQDMVDASLQMRSIKELCDKWYISNAATWDMILERNQVIEEFQTILGLINPECKCRLQGSLFHGSATKFSDINLELIHPNSELFGFDLSSKKSMHHKLVDPDAEFGNQFNLHTLHYDLVSNPVETLYNIFTRVQESSRTLASYPFTVISSLKDFNRKVPKVILKHKLSDVELEINCYSESSYHLSNLIRTYALVDDRLDELCLLIKVWAKLCGIDDPENGSYSPCAYSILMIYFLQRTTPPVLPCLHELVSKEQVRDLGSRSRESSTVEVSNNIYASSAKQIIPNEVDDDDQDDMPMVKIDEKSLENLDWISNNNDPVHKLFIQFFKTMIQEFSTTKVISIRTLQPITNPWSFQYKPIENPIHPKFRILNSITSLKTHDYIRDSFYHTYYYLNSLPLDKKLNKRRIFESDPKNYIQLYVNISRLFNYKVMREPTMSSRSQYDPVSEMVQQNLFARDIETIAALTSRDNEERLPKTLANLYDINFLHPQNRKVSISCWLCRSTGHSRIECPRGSMERLYEEFDSNDSELDELVNLDELIMTLYKKGSISHQLSIEHKRVVSDLHRAINGSFDIDLDLVLYGSTVNNLGSRDSDLDICVTVKGNPTGKGVNCIDVLVGIKAVLETLEEVKNIQPVLSAKVPIIRFQYLNFDVDMSMYNQCAIYNSKLLRAYASIDSRVAPLCYLVKRHAKTCGIADASKGSLSSYAWSLMVIYYLQRTNPPILPVLQEPADGTLRGCVGVNGWNVWFHDKPVRSSEYPISLTSLFKGFFLFYGVFDFETDVISIRKLKTITKFQKSWTNSMIAIEDPFELTYNLSNRLNDLMAIFIINSFAQAFRHVVRLQQSINLNYETPQRFAKRLFDGLAITRIGPPLRGCLFCHRIGHKLKDCPEKQNETASRRLNGLRRRFNS